MNILIVGGTGLIGRSLSAHVQSYAPPPPETMLFVTTRQKELGIRKPRYWLELTRPREFDISILPAGYYTVFLCAGVSGFKECEGKAESWRVNVDGVLDIALRMIHERGAFVVYPSTQAVEWSGAAYARQRAQVEAVLLAGGSTAIVRVGRVTQANASKCAAFLFECGTKRQMGVYQWS